MEPRRFRFTPDKPQMEYQLTFDDDPESIRIRSAWGRAVTRLQSSVSNGQFQKFLEPLKPAKRDGNDVIVVVPGDFRRQWVEKNFLGSLQAALSDELGESVEVKLVAAPHNRARSAQPEPVGATVATKEERFHDKFTFESFVVGRGTQLAFAGAQAVAAAPGAKYNPLFIYGPTGYGKTHLLHAIANHLLLSDGDYTISYVPAQDFAERFVAALQHGRMDQFRKQVRSVDVWLVDDVQFIAGKDRTQEELFHTFNQLQSSGKHIVFTSDRPPRDIYVDDRLRSRFESGLVADIVAPDTETRAAIVKSKADADGIELPYEVCEYLAIHVPGNIRTLEGALTRLIAEASFAGSGVTVDVAQAVVGASFPAASGRKPTFDQILDEVSAFYGIPRRDIIGPSRQAPIAKARHMAVFLVRSMSGDSWKQLGDKFGSRDHTSMIHAFRRISHLLASDLETQAEHRQIERKLVN